MEFLAKCEFGLCLRKLTKLFSQAAFNKFNKHKNKTKTKQNHSNTNLITTNVFKLNCLFV